MNCNAEYEYKQVSTKNILVDPLYQRELDRNRVSKIVSEFDPRLVNAVKVSFRDGRYYCFDGQHTMAVLKACHENRDCMIECKVFYGLTWYDEAHLFILQSGRSSSVDVNAKFRTLFNMGDPDIKRMVSLCEKCGIRVDFTRNKCQNKIVALSTLFRVMKTSSTEKEFTDVLCVIKSAWGGTPESFSNEILKGVSLFCHTYSGKYDKKTLIKRLSKVSVIAIIRDAKVSSAAGDRKYARQVLAVYNSGTSSNRLQDLL